MHDDTKRALARTETLLQAQRERIESLEAAIREMIRSIPGGQVCDPQKVADAMRAIAERHGVKTN